MRLNWSWASVSQRIGDMFDLWSYEGHMVAAEMVDAIPAGRPAEGDLVVVMLFRLPPGSRFGAGALDVEHPELGRLAGAIAQPHVAEEVEPGDSRREAWATGFLLRVSFVVGG